MQVDEALQAVVVVVSLYDIVGEIDQQLGQTTLSCRVVTEHRAEGCVAQRLRETLSQSFPGSCVIAEAQEATDNVLK